MSHKAHYFSAQISQEFSDQVKNLASNLNIPSERIVFKTEGCPVGSIGVYIKFETKNTLNEFSKKIQAIPCIIKQW